MCKGKVLLHTSLLADCMVLEPSSVSFSLALRGLSGTF